MCNLTYGPGEGGSAQGREGVGTPRGQGGPSVLRERGAGEWAAGGGGGGPPTVIFALVNDSPLMLLPGCPGWGVHAAQGRAGRGREKEKQQAAQEQGGQGGRGAGVAPGVRHNPVFGSPGEEFPPLHPCPAPLSTPYPPKPPYTQSREPGAPPGVPEMRRLCHPTQCCRSLEKE